MNNPYGYNSMTKDAESKNQGSCFGYVKSDTNPTCEHVGNICSKGPECNNTYQCFQGFTDSDAENQCETALSKLGPHGGNQPHGGGNQPHGGGKQPHGGNPVGGGGNGGNPSPSPGSKSWWNSPAGIATIIAIALGSAILITVVFYLIRRATMKKRSK